MSGQHQPEEYQVNNDRSLQQLAWAIAASVGQFKLILARCNYASLRDRLIEQLQAISPVEIRVLRLQPSHKTLYTAIRAEFGEELPACLMVLGWESVQNLAQMFTAANQVREEFRQHFPFPVVLWIDDEIYKQLMQVAPDLESWAITRNFPISQQQLINFISETANQWFSNNLKLSFDRYLKLETELAAAQQDLLGSEQGDHLEIQADLASLLGFSKQINNKLDAALEHYQAALPLWQQINYGERQGIILCEMALCCYLQAFNNQDIHHPDWQPTRHYVQEYINFLNQNHHPDLIANSIFKFGEILARLQNWESLKSFATQALAIHQADNKFRELAKDYGYLAAVALAQENWLEANQYANQALKVFSTISSQELAQGTEFLSESSAKIFNSRDGSLYQFLLARSQYHLGEIPAAIHSLETATQVGNPQGDVRFYLEILRFLQQLYFNQKEYLKAYKIKQQRRSIEQQFGLRAFIGAGRLEAIKQPLLATPNFASPQENIATEIAASGRQLDVERLIQRIGEPSYKLIVICGQSGVGKSSLVNGGIVPALKNKAIGIQDNLPIVMRVYSNWEEELGRFLRGDGGDGEVGRWGDGEMGRWGDGGELEDKAPLSSMQYKIISSPVGARHCRALTSVSDSTDSEPKTPTSEPETQTSEPKTPTSEPKTPTSEPETPTSEHETSASEHETSTSEHETSTSEHDASTSEHKTSTSEHETSTSEHETSASEHETSASEHETSASEHETSASEHGTSASEHGTSTSEHETSASEHETSASEHETSTSEHETSASEHGTSASEHETSASEHEASTSEHETSASEHETSASEHETSPSEHETSASEHESSTSEHETSASEHETSTSEPETSTSEPETSTSEPETSTSEPETPTSEPETSKPQPSPPPHLPISPPPHLPTSPPPHLPTSPPPHLPTSPLLAQLRENEQRHLRTVLIFDQFEEFFFVYPQPAQRKRFFEFLGACLNVLSVKVILSLRVDYLHYLLECNRLPSMKIIGHDILSNNVLYELGNFSPDDAKLIIQRLTEKTSFHLEPALVDQLVADLAAELGEVRPIELQVVGAQLQTDNITTLAEYQQRGTKEQLVKRYLAEVVQDCGEENQQLAELVLYLLTDEKGTRPLKTRAELEQDLRTLNLESTQTPPNLPDFSRDLENLSPNLSPARREALNSPPYLVGKGAGGLGFAFVFPHKVKSQPRLRGGVPQAGRGLDLIMEIFVQSGLVVLLPGNPADRYQLVHDYLAAFIRQQPEPKLKQVMAELEKERTQRKISEAKLNSFLKRARFGSLAAAAVLAGLTVTAWNVAQNAQEQKNQAETWVIKEINNLNNFSERTLASGQHPDALIAALKAGEKLKSISLPQKRSDIQMQTVATLQQAVYLQPNEKKENRAVEGKTLKGHSDRVNSVGFSPDGKQLVSGSADNTIKLWDVTTGKPLKTLTGHSNWVNSVGFSPDGKQLVSGSADNTIKLWDVTTGKPLKTFSGHSDWVNSVGFSPDGKQLVSGSVDNTIKLWDVTTGEPLKTFSGHRGGVNSVGFSPDGKQLVSGSGDGTIKLWDITTGKPLKTFSGHSRGVNSVGFSPDGKQLVSGSLDNTIKLWDVTTGEPLKTFSGHSRGVNSVGFSPDGKQLVSGSGDGTIKLWDVTTGKPLKTLTGHSRGVRSVGFSPDGKQLVSGSFDGTIKLWDVTTGKTLKTLSGHRGGVNSVGFSPDGKQLVSGGGDGTIKLWDVTTGKTLKTLSGHRSVVMSVGFSPDGKQLVHGSFDGTIKLWDVTTGKTLKTLSGHSGWVSSVGFSPDGKQLVSGGGDGTIKLWDVTTGKPLKTLSGHSGWVMSVGFSPDGKQLVSGSDDKTIKLWDVTTGKTLKTLSGHSGWVMSVGFSPDGKQLVSGSDDKTIKLWDVTTGKPLKTLSGHSSWVYSVGFSPDGKQLVSGSDDKTIKLWDVTTGKPLKTLSGHSSWVYSVGFSPDGKQLVSGSDDKTIIVWDLNLAELLTSGCNLLNNYLIAHPEVLEELKECQTSIAVGARGDGVSQPR